MDFTELINLQAQNQATSDIPEEKRNTPMASIENAILNDQYTIDPKKQINVIGKDNISYSLPGHQLKDALQQGYRLEAPNETAKREFVKSYKGLKGDAIVGLGQFADEFLAGIPEAIYDTKLEKDDFDKKEALKADHELANTLGGVAGFGASLFYGGPLAKIAGVGEKAGAKVASSLSSSLAKRGISKEAASLGAKILAKTAEKTAQLGIEGLVQATPMAITETALGNPEAGAETLMMGGGFGAGLGILTGPTQVIFNKANKATKEAIKKQFGQGLDDAIKGGTKVSEEGAFTRSSIDPTTQVADNLADTAKIEGVSDSVVEELKKGLGKVKSNINEIKEASELLGTPILEGQISASKVVQDFDSALSKKATLSGIARANKYQDIFNKSRDAIKNAFNIGENSLSKFQVGTEAKQAILQNAENAIKTEGNVFNELRQNYSDILLNKKSMQQVLNNIKQMSKEAIDDNVISLTKNIANKIEQGRINTLNDLFSLRTQIRDLWSPTASSGTKKAIGDLVDKLNYQEEMTINRAIKKRIESASVPGGATFEEASRLQGLYDDMQVAKKNWYELAKNLEDSGDALNLGNIKNPRDFVAKVKNLTAEQLAGKLIPKNDFESLQILREKFPQQFEAVSKLEKAKLLEGITVDDQINPIRFKNQYAKMLKERPEFASVLFNSKQKKMLDAVRTVIESLPENVNPSGTAKTLSYMGGITGMAAENVQDFISSKVLKKIINVDDLINTEKEIVNVNKKLNTIPEMLKNLKDTTSKISSIESIMAATTLLGKTSEERRQAFDELKDKLDAAVSNPSIILENINKHSEGYNNSAPKIMEQFIKKNSNSIQYLYQSIPKPLNQSTPFYERKFIPSDVELAKFERKLSVAMDPFVVFDALRDGSLTKDHMESLIVNYPLLANAIKERIFNAVSTNKINMDYQSRLKMSLLMGYDVDGTTAPQNIRGYQNAFAISPQVSENELNHAGLMKMNPAEQAMTKVQKGLTT